MWPERSGDDLERRGQRIDLDHQLVVEVESGIDQPIFLDIAVRVVTKVAAEIVQIELQQVSQYRGLLAGGLQ